jgi:hypothetical protein
MVRRETFRGKKVGFVQDSHSGIYGADPLHKLSFERNGDRDDGFRSRHVFIILNSVKNTEHRTGRKSSAYDTFIPLLSRKAPWLRSLICEAVEIPGADPASWAPTLPGSGA